MPAAARPPLSPLPDEPLHPASPGQASFKQQAWTIAVYGPLQAEYLRDMALSLREIADNSKVLADRLLRAGGV